MRDVAAAAAPGSELVVEFIAPASSLGAEEGTLVDALAAGTARVGEPWLSFFEPADMEAVLRRAGFSSVVHFGPREATERYLRGRTDDLRLPAYFRMAKATTGPGPAGGVSHPSASAELNPARIPSSPDR